MVKKGTLLANNMRQVSKGIEDSLDSLRNRIDEALEEMIASRVDSGEVVELSGKVLLAGVKDYVR